MHHVAVLVGQNLDFDMSCALNVLLHKYSAIAKGARGFATRLFQPGLQLPSRADDTHATPAAAKRSLGDQRKGDGLGGFLRRLETLHRLLGPRHNPDASLLRKVAGRYLVSKQLEQFR